MRDPIKIPLDIKSRREELGFTQQQLADLLGVKRPTMANYEASRYLMSPKVIRRAAVALKVPVESLLPME